jgi:hypothetical protein
VLRVRLALASWRNVAVFALASAVGRAHAVYARLRIPGSWSSLARRLVHSSKASASQVGE